MSIRLDSRDGIGLIRLRSLESVAELPAEVGEVQGDDPAILCLAPREWITISEAEAVPDLVDHWSSVNPGRLIATDVSDGHSIIVAQGSGAAWLLCKTGSLDFLQGKRAGRHCARTRIGQAPVIVYFYAPAGEEYRFELIVERSLEKYLRELLNASLAHANELAETHGDMF